MGAKKEDLIKCYETADMSLICKEILTKGELQVSDKERQAEREALFKEVATTITERCVNPETKRPYPVSMIEKAMKECHIAVKPNKGAKQQALKIVVPIKDLNKLNKKIKTMNLTKESDEKVEDTMTLIFLVDPGEYRNLDEIVKNDTQGRGQLEILSLKEFDDSEQQLGT